MTPLSETYIGDSASVGSRENCAFALAEVLLASAVVLAHNVWHVLPNEVPILVILLWVSLLLRRKPWSSVGFTRPASWARVVLLALAAAVLLQIKDVVTEPFAHLFWKQQEHVSSIITQTHTPLHMLKSLEIVWVFAAFGEEIGYRGLLLRRLADGLGGSSAAYVFASLWSSVLFGFGHFYKGPTGVFDSTVSGLILGGVYVLSRRNLWPSILAHGLSDSFAVLFNFFAA
jgi:CAAX protease family protein